MPSRSAVQLDFPESLKRLQQQIDAALKGKTFVRIRNSIAFHYPKRRWFEKLTQDLSDSDATIFLVPTATPETCCRTSLRWLGAAAGHQR